MEGGLTFTKLRAELRSMGWDTTVVSATTVRARHRTQQGVVEVFVRLGEHWLVVTAVPFLRTQGKNSFELTRWLLRQNHDLAQAKFAIDEDGDIVVTAELPTESIDPGEIRTAARAVLDAVVQHRATLRAASGR